MEKQKRGRGRPPMQRPGKPLGWKPPLGRAVEVLLAERDKRMTRADLARKCKWTTQNLYRILLCDLGDITVASLSKLAKGLGVGADVLMAKVAVYEQADRNNTRGETIHG